MALNMQRTGFTDAEKTCGTGTNEDFIIFSTAKYIHNKNYHEEGLRVEELTSILRRQEKVEARIAEKRGKEWGHKKKWEAMASLLDA